MRILAVDFRGEKFQCLAFAMLLNRFECMDYVQDSSNVVFNAVMGPTMKTIVLCNCGHHNK